MYFIEKNDLIISLTMLDWFCRFSVNYFSDAVDAGSVLRVQSFSCGPLIQWWHISYLWIQDKGL